MILTTQLALHHGTNSAPTTQAHYRRCLQAQNHGQSHSSRHLRTEAGDHDWYQQPIPIKNASCARYYQRLRPKHEGKFKTQSVVRFGSGISIHGTGTKTSIGCNLWRGSGRRRHTTLRCHPEAPDFPPGVYHRLTQASNKTTHTNQTRTLLLSKVLRCGFQDSSEPQKSLRQDTRICTN